MKPDWLKIKDFDRGEYSKTAEFLKGKGVHTVCIEADCPNRYECFSKKAATFLILGDVCTRNCLYCGVRKGVPKNADNEENGKIVDCIKRMNIKYAVITCVSRDDMEDGGAGFFVDIIRRIRKECPKCRVEFLISDLNGNFGALKRIVKEKPDVIAHNIEVVESLFGNMRQEGDYSLSLSIIRKINESGIRTKSGLMVGLGENREEVIKTMKELKESGCGIMTIGQYLQPNRSCAVVKKFYSPEEFREFKRIGEKMGFEQVVSGPLVRSSYHAGDYSNEAD